MTFSENLKAARTNQGLSMQEAAKLVGIPLSAWSNYEAGRREPRLEVLRKIADFFAMSTDSLIGRKSLLYDEAKARAKDIAGMEFIEHEGDNVTVRCKSVSLDMTHEEFTGFYNKAMNRQESKEDSLLYSFLLEHAKAYVKAAPEEALRFISG